jgi:hypothetical protein
MSTASGGASASEPDGDGVRGRSPRASEAVRRAATWMQEVLR